MESELFGYAKGAFTGALSQGKPGKFELADNGTVFLDEIGELPLEMQPKLLRVLEDKEFERVGGTRIIHSDFRLIAATNQDLEAMMAQGRFRKDLFYRLNVIPLHIPPLRERSEDTLPLARHILSQLAREAGAGQVSLSPEAEALLRSYHWPGNVRELTNVLERTLSSLENDILEPDDFPRYFTGQKQPQCDRDQGTLQEVVNRAERQAIIRALERSGQNKAKAAKMLGIHRTLLYKKMHKLGLAG
jgi:transcriptional regulator with PAS, ATPase and Fis domain